MSDSRQPIVATKSGKIEGSFENGLHVFRGIPYAEPTMGKLRWLPPQAVKPWDGIRPAKKYGAICPQNIMPGSGAPGAPDFANQPQDEDCLSLNIWTPGLDNAKRPVLFWIHGGAFIIGSGCESFLETGILPRRGDIVLVSINYRLGAFGFLNLKEITGGQIPATGNEGLLDQIAALDWVVENISAFGGDPDNITAAGFSAGAMSIGTLSGMPRARGKFHKIMNRSGAANVVGSLDTAIRISEMYVNAFGLKGKDTESLCKLTTKQLLDGQQELGNTLREAEYRATPFQPVVDGEVLPEWPIEAIRKGSARDIAVIVGNTLDELKAMTAMDPRMRNFDEDELFKRLNGLLPSDAVPGLVNVYRDALKKRGSKADPADIMGSISTDMMWRIPTIRLIEAQRDNGAPAYNYLFTLKSPAMGGILGAMHGLDNPFLFGCLDKEFSGNGPEEQSLATKIQDSTIAFMRTGDPSCKSIGKWPVYGKNRLTMILDKNTRVEAAPYEPERAVWDKIELLYTRPM
jgi:para-nitrobenzyl esterase